MVTQDDSLEVIRQHVENVRDFFYHLMTYVVVNLLVIILDRRAGTGEQAVAGLDWAYWVILFWGLGVLGHAVLVFFGDYRAHKLHTRQVRR